MVEMGAIRETDDGAAVAEARGMPSVEASMSRRVNARPPIELR